MGVCGTECKLKNFGLDHPNPRTFVEPQGGGGSLVYMIYRVAVAVYFGIVLIYSGVDFEYGAKWFIFLTYWGLVVLAVNVFLQALLLMGRYPPRCEPDGELCTRKMPIVLKIVWILQNLTLSSAVVVSIVYWTVVYDGGDLNFVNVSAHAINSVYVICDVCVTGIPVRMVHFYQPFVLVVFYAIFSVSYWAAGGTNHLNEIYIYRVLDYKNKPIRASIWLLVLFIFIVLIHMLMYAIYRLRVYLYSLCARARALPQVGTTSPEVSVDTQL